MIEVTISYEDWLDWRSKRYSYSWLKYLLDKNYYIDKNSIDDIDHNYRRKLKVYLKGGESREKK